MFLEDSGISESFPKRDISLEELRVELPNPEIQEPTEVYQFVPPIIPNISSTVAASGSQVQADMPAAGAQASVAGDQAQSDPSAQPQSQSQSQLGLRLTTA